VPSVRAKERDAAFLSTWRYGLARRASLESEFPIWSEGTPWTMSILGSALKAELADAVGVADLRKEMRRELRALQREVSRLRTLLQGHVRRASRALGSEPAAPATFSAEQIRTARTRLGESRRAFAARLKVSPSIIFLWESGRSRPRRGAIVSRLEQLMSAPPLLGTIPAARVRPASKPVRRRRAALKLEGRYLVSAERNRKTA
jgi:DNA-binding transcriptional regulator YiaG